MANPWEDLSANLRSIFESPYPESPADSKVILFADVLGFASLTEKYPVDLNLIQATDWMASWPPNRMFAAHRNKLTKTFNGFHSSLKGVTDLAQMAHPLTAITFSDSAFIATTYLFEAVKMAVGLVQALLPQEIPLRIGIAHGSFAAVRFRSDVTSKSSDHASHFLGTGVVRAHAAETCGIKGIRILLHPSATSLLNNSAHNPLTSAAGQIRHVECAPEECGNNVGTRYEIDYWQFKPTAEGKAWHAIQDMWDSAPPFALDHYQATAEAINRMRMGQGEPPLNTLRRRTLPRRSKNLNLQTNH